MQTKNKDFLTIDELIKYIKMKKIKIKNEEQLRLILEYNNYYCITGYKKPFKKNDDTYKDSIYFEDIYALYEFDKKLKLIFAEVLFKIEQKVKTVFTNNFCKVYGNKDFDLINPNNYDINSRFLSKKIAQLNEQIEWYGKENSAVMYYKNKYSFIPIWVLIKVLTFGMIRDLIVNSTSAAKGCIVNKITTKKLTVNETQNMLELLVNLRNICCHDDRLYGFIHNKVHIMNTPYHKHFNLKQNAKGEYLQGKKDLFAVLICIKYFIDKDCYNNFIDNIENLINYYSNKIESISKQEILQHMFLPDNFTDIKEL